MKDVVVVIVVQYAATLSPSFFECVRSVIESGGRLLVVDQASTGEAVERIKETIPSVTVIRNPRNTGFAAGANQAVRFLLSSPHSSCETIVFLDARTVADPKTIGALVQTLRERRGVGMVGPKWLSLYEEHALDESLHEQVASDRVFSLGVVRHAGGPFTHAGFGQTDTEEGGAHEATALHYGLLAVHASALGRIKLDDETYLDPWFLTTDVFIDAAWRFTRAGYGVECARDIEVHWPCGVFTRSRRRSIFRQLHDRTERSERALAIFNALCLPLMHVSMWRLVMEIPAAAWNLFRWKLFLLVFDRASLAVFWGLPRHLGWILRRRKALRAFDTKARDELET
ncbi:hypothetical protein A3C17_02575 [Candidatus Uhrbacteria bacterium RIFCSPHIGHO2_02_FULL_53_13]|uniref:Glycosyltransferase 2-like domain-containing protein n=1 Tax=Candidatus Uhrbacteria bacterium RIFCSPHIGHO2_02_FULL_53_13 TaxID=1802389 RepID=A0A1F7TZG9_9BACT|nr:MAG: hypothetical protein A3C17_02575 [Candidatus Uhrbacteria bacterium RIFCSPHIGHO2_02_FULL_53_13]